MGELETDWANRLNTLGDSSAESDLFFKRQAEEPIDEDHNWLLYVASLTPDDHRAAFLLPGELPDSQSGAQQVRNAMETAMRRAFSNPQMRIEDYVLGWIQGRLRVLLPQGIEHSYNFENELGWKATIVISRSTEERSFPAYYRRTCMNPLRRAALLGQLDSSEVLFKPVDGDQIEKMAADPEVDHMTVKALKRLYRQYLMLSGQGDNL